MSARDTYLNFEAPETTGEWLKSIFSPSSNLSRFDNKKDNTALLNDIDEQSRLDEISSKKQKRLIFWGLGSVLVIGLGVGLYVAFKK